MPLYVKNSVHTVNCGWQFKHEKEYDHTLFNINMDSLQEQLGAKIEELNGRGLIVKAVVPITTGFSKTEAKYWNGNGGYGYGYGLSIVTGYTIFATDERHVSEEEYKRLTRIDFLKNRQKEVESELQELQSVQEKSGGMLFEIKVEKGILGTKYVVNDEKFKTEAEAQARKAEMDELHNISQMSVAKLQAEQQEIRAELASLKA